MRREKILAGLREEHLALEIGGGYNPLTAGPSARHLDQADQETLRTKFAAEGADPKNVPHIDYVWNGTSYAELVGDDRFDWIVASHVIEHMPCMIRFFKECEAILKDDGILSLAVPDKRYCFDHYRPSAALARVIDTYLHEVRRPTAGALAEMLINASALEGDICWNAGRIGNPTLIHGVSDALAAMERSQSGAYCDTHVWAFTPNAFRLLIHDLNALGFTRFAEISFTPTTEGEFYIQLGLDLSSTLNRTDLAHAALMD